MSPPQTLIGATTDATAHTPLGGGFAEQEGAGAGEGEGEGGEGEEESLLAPEGEESGWSGDGEDHTTGQGQEEEEGDDDVGVVGGDLGVDVVGGLGVEVELSAAPTNECRPAGSSPVTTTTTLTTAPTSHQSHTDGTEGTALELMPHIPPLSADDVPYADTTYAHVPVSSHGSGTGFHHNPLSTIHGHQHHPSDSTGVITTSQGAYATATTATLSAAYDSVGVGGVPVQATAPYTTTYERAAVFAQHHQSAYHVGPHHHHHHPSSYTTGPLPPLEGSDPTTHGPMPLSYSHTAPILGTFRCVSVCYAHLHVRVAVTCLVFAHRGIGYVLVNALWIGKWRAHTQLTQSHPHCVAHADYALVSCHMNRQLGAHTHFAHSRTHVRTLTHTRVTCLSTPHPCSSHEDEEGSIVGASANAYAQTTLTCLDSRDSVASGASEGAAEIGSGYAHALG